MKQLNYILKRILQMIPVLFAVTIIIFWGIRLIPGNPALTVLGEKASQSAIEAMEKRWGWINQFENSICSTYEIWLIWTLVILFA